MISNKGVLGLIFANMHDNTVSDLTKQRTMGSIMFGGRYRLIDFPLSNMVNSGVSEVGVITKSNYQSLLDHLGSGREWDLARKHGGLHLLPPFSHVGIPISTASRAASLPRARGERAARPRSSRGCVLLLKDSQMKKECLNCST